MVMQAQLDTEPMARPVGGGQTFLVIELHQGPEHLLESHPEHGAVLSELSFDLEPDKGGEVSIVVVCSPLTDKFWGFGEFSSHERILSLG